MTKQEKGAGEVGRNARRNIKEGGGRMSDWITNEPPAYETITVVCRCPKCHEVVPLLVTSKAGSHILRIDIGEEEE